jgi:hypothetical protein
VHDSLAAVPIELGAEFEHGLSPEMSHLMNTPVLTVYEQTRRALHIDRGRVLTDKKVGEIADRVLSRLKESVRRKDESFEDYLRRCRPADERNGRVCWHSFDPSRTTSPLCI